MPVLTLNSVEDTSLWKHLKNDFQGNDKGVAETLANNLKDICQEAYDRMKAFPSLHPEYTLHDEVHCLRVTELMYKIMPQPVIESLNPIEIALLILSAHFHDQGMVLEAGEIGALDVNSEFRVFKDNWILNHPNLQNVKQILKDKNVSEAERATYNKTIHELEAALLTDYVRTTHGRRSSDFVHGRYDSDARWKALESSLVEFVARLSLSHVKSAYDLTDANGFRRDEVIGTYQVNMVYLGLILRLADILDFDRERTPDSLYRTIDFRSQVSLSEWEKHRSVNGWVIDSTKIQFTMICEHPEYQRAALQFMDGIDKELAEAQGIIHSFPAEFSRYNLQLPRQVDRSRIEPRNNSYVYHDLEFSLSRDEIINLLMTEQLYGSPSLAIRELLQNSLDALRHRKAQTKRDAGADWNEGKVTLEHHLDEHGHENIRCIDNGIGMDEDIIKRFLTKTGRSYYRSPEFEQERIRLREANVDFDPCAQFGIGFMSCFMLGDQITIHTRRDNGENGRGEPLIVEINGFNSMVVIRKGDANQPIGTTINITGRKLPRGFEYWQDRTHLIEVLHGYAMATEFPIEASVNIPEINESTSIPPTFAPPITPIEEAKIKSQITFEQKFSEIHPLLNGIARASFITDENGLLTLENDEAKWVLNENDKIYKIKLVLTDGREIKDSRRPDDSICLDGILVAGDPGREDKKRPYSLGWKSSVIHLGHTEFLLDIRGQIKPPLTPARHPPDESRRLFSEDNRWSYIRQLALRAQGRLWEQVAEQLAHGLDSEVFWQIVVINNQHDIHIDRMRSGKIWELISVPLLNNDNSLEWKKVSDLGVTVPEGDTELKYSDGRLIQGNESLDRWLDKQSKDLVKNHLANLVKSMSTIVISNGQVCLELRPPRDYSLIPAENYVSGSMVLPYDGSISTLLSVHSSFSNANHSHPLVKVALNSKLQENKSALEEFAIKAVACLSDVKLFEAEKDHNRLRWERNVGFLYEDVDWNGINNELKPPYLVRNTNGEIVEITSEHFKQWTNVDINMKKSDEED